MQINKYFISYSIAIAICFNLLSYNSFGYFYQNNISSVSKDTVIDIITNDTTYEEAYSKDSIIKKSLFSFKKNWITTKSLIYDSAALISKRLLEEDPIFLENWSNNEVFTYDKVGYADLPDKIIIPLVKNDEKFQLTWYGNLNFKYGWRWGRMHRGLDLFLRMGDSVVSAFDGVVRYARFNAAGFGNCVVVRHLNGLETVYAHLSKISVAENQFVNGGELLGLGGTTGRSNGPHLHFETRYKDFSIDPELYVDVKKGELISDTLTISKATLQALKYPSVVVRYRKGRYSKSYLKKGTSKKYAKKAPVKKKGTTKAPVKKKSTTKAPIKKASTTKAPIKKASTSKAPIKKASTSKAPIKKASTSKAPIKQVNKKK